MSVPRRFLAPEAAQEDEIRLAGPESHHLLRVLRLAPGTAVEVFDGAGRAFSAHFVQVDREGRCLLRRSGALAAREPEVRLTVAVAVPKGDGLTGIVRQLAEIGAGAITPLLTERSEGRSSPVRLRRWRAAALSGTRQSGRAAVPPVGPPVRFEAWIRTTLPPDRWIASPRRPDAESPGDDPLSRVPARVLAVGPEGGFSPAELDDAYRHGFRRLDLGDRVLRTGTACVLAAAMLLPLKGGQPPDDAR